MLRCDSANVVHDPNESVDNFAVKLAPMARAAFSGERESAIMKRTLEEFVDKIKGLSQNRFLDRFSCINLDGEGGSAHLL